MPSADRIRQGLTLIRAGLTDLDPADLPGPEAASLANLCADAERLVAATKIRLARRVADTEAYRQVGHRTAGGWLAAISGQSVGQARDQLATMARTAAAPAVEAAVARGDLSLAQAKVIGAATAVDPSSADALLSEAKKGSLRRVKVAADQVKARARGEEGEVARERRAHAGRFCRVWQPDAGGLRLEAWLSKRDGARLLAGLDRETDAIAVEGRRAGVPEPHDRHRADALVRLVARSGRPTGVDDTDGSTGDGDRAGDGPGARPDTRVLVLVDAAALRRGATEGTETCEIAGIGPVPVATARELLGDCYLNILVTDGVDIRTVTSTKRTIPRSLRIALWQRDPTCVVPGCPITRRLQIDHWRVDWARDGRTELDNLARLCPAHHDLKTNHGWRLAGGPGRWRWVRPKRPPGPTTPSPGAGPTSSWSRRPPPPR